MSSERTTADIVGKHIYQIGRIAVDSGTIVLADPSYVIHFAEEHPDAWETMCERTGFGPNDPYGEPMGGLMGLHLETPHGDGIYPVYAELDQLTGRPTRIVIDLDPSGD